MTIEKAVSENISIASTLRSLRKAVTGSNYIWLKNQVVLKQLDVTHWKGQKHGSSIQIHKYKIEDLFVENGKAPTVTVKRRILKDRLKEYICAVCLCLPIHNEKPLTLILDHINGINNDHRLENLRFVCPNCDSQSDTYCGRNKTNALIV